MPCSFCQIDPSKTVVLRDKKYCRVVFSNPRLVVGHLLVIPKRHVERPQEMNKEEQLEIFETVLEYQGLVLGRLATGCDVRQNYRPFLPESRVKINHVHYHIIPRELNDAIYESTKKQTELFVDMPEGEAETLFDILK